MQRAERQPVVLGVGSARLVPTDVRRVLCNRRRTHAHVEPAHGAAVLVGHERPLPELRVALPTDARHGVEFEADGGEDVLVERVGEVTVEQAVHDLGRERDRQARRGLRA